MRGLFPGSVRRNIRLCAAKAPRHKFRFKSKLFSPGATTIKLCLALFPWASFRQTKGGIKMHALLGHDGHIPVFTTVTDAKRAGEVFDPAVKRPSKKEQGQENASTRHYSSTHEIPRRRGYPVMSGTGEQQAMPALHLDAYYRQEQIMRHLEKEYGLTQVTPSSEAARRSLIKGEVEHAARTGQPSTKRVLQSVVDKAL